MCSEKITIAIDGYSSCGKSTIAKDLAKKLNYIFIDSGAMYRAITLYALENGIISDKGINEEKLKQSIDAINIEFELDHGGIPEILLNGKNVAKEIREPRVSNNVSQIAKYDFVREKLVREQRTIGKNGGIVMDGRDIGTVVFPEAELKIFVTADVNIRAERRFKELKGLGTQITLDEVRQNLTDRDLLDTTRKISPLKQAKDAIVLDNSHLDREQQLSYALDLVNKRCKILN